jgi:hypothetical protein
MDGASFPRAPRAAVDQAEGYAAGVTGSTIHNFRSYLELAGTSATRFGISGRASRRTRVVCNQVGGEQEPISPARNEVREGRTDAGDELTIAVGERIGQALLEHCTSYRNAHGR